MLGQVRQNFDDFLAARPPGQPWHVDLLDRDNIPYDDQGKRLPLNIALEPNYEPRKQPMEVTIGAT